jgi:hypothetical protein
MLQGNYKPKAVEQILEAFYNKICNLLHFKVAQA